MEFVCQILMKLKTSSNECLLMKVFSHSLMWLSKHCSGHYVTTQACTLISWGCVHLRWCGSLEDYTLRIFLSHVTLKFDGWPKKKQGKSEGFESCDWPIVRKRPIWVKIGDVLYRVTLKFDGWPWKTIGHLSFAISSFVQHFIAIGEFKLELQSGNAHFGSNSTIFRAVWPWNLTDDLEKQ